MANLGEDLLEIVNRLQDLVFNTIGNDSLDLPQIVCQLGSFGFPQRTKYSNRFVTSRSLSAPSLPESPLFSKI